MRKKTKTTTYIIYHIIGVWLSTALAVDIHKTILSSEFFELSFHSFSYYRLILPSKLETLRPAEVVKGWRFCKIFSYFQLYNKPIGKPSLFSSLPIAATTLGCSPT